MPVASGILCRGREDFCFVCKAFVWGGDMVDPSPVRVYVRVRG